MIINFNEFSDVNDLIDAILDKISDEGYKSLTDKEKDVLNKHSKGQKIDMNTIKGEKPTVKKLDMDDIPTDGNIKDFLANRGGFRGNDAPYYGEMNHPNRLKVGDKIKPMAVSGDKLPKYATDFLETSDEFVVLRVNDSGKVDIGCSRKSNGKKKVFYFSSMRFRKVDEAEDYDFDDDIEEIGEIGDQNPDDFNELDWENGKEYVDFTGQDNPALKGLGKKKKLEPQDYYFHVQQFDNYIMIAMTSVDFFNRYHGLDDNLVSESLSQQVRAAMNRSGVYADTEAAEAMWEAIPGFTVEEITNNMINEGFLHDQEFIDMLEHGAG